MDNQHFPGEALSVLSCTAPYIAFRGLSNLPSFCVAERAIRRNAVLHMLRGKRGAHMNAGVRVCFSWMTTGFGGGGGAWDFTVRFARLYFKGRSCSGPRSCARSWEGSMLGENRLQIVRTGQDCTGPRYKSSTAHLQDYVRKSISLFRSRCGQ
jgi:hypothetical protein